MRPGDVPGWPAEKALLSGVWLQFGAVQKQSWSHATGSAMKADLVRELGEQKPWPLSRVGAG